MTRRPSAALVAALVALPLAALPFAAAGAQVTNVRTVKPESSPGTTATTAQAAQAEFERYRRQNLPGTPKMRGGAGNCDEQIGNWCYWYDENEPPAPAEPARIKEARAKLIATLDSAATGNPTDAWLAAQRVRYLVESKRMDDALAAARACKAEGWWCTGLTAFVQHARGEYAAAERSFDSALARMPERERCEWTDLTLLLDDAQLQAYRQLPCGEKRTAWERRLWWLARPLFSTEGNDARTEMFARRMMARMLQGSAVPHQLGFGEDERELMLRYGWSRAWTRSGSSRGFNDSLGVSIVGHEPAPAYPFLPNSFILDNPGNSTAERWLRGVAPIRARYAPEYGMPIRALEHQSAVFRRGDSALVVLAYDAARDSAFSQVKNASAALVLTRGDESDAKIVRADEGQELRGVLTATAPWGASLMSAEVASQSEKRTARARYGVRPPHSVGARVSVSDLLLFRPYGTIPSRLEEALPHALPTLKVRANERVGFFWEAYGTNPAGEQIGVSLTVAEEDPKEPGGLARLGRRLRLWKDASPVSVSLSDVSARGVTTSPRAVLVDIETLAPGTYVVELELDIASQYRVRATRRIEVVK